MQAKKISCVNCRLDFQTSYLRIQLLTYFYMQIKMIELKRVATRDNITEADADKKINRVNKERHEHCRLVTGREWGLAKHYDLSNTLPFSAQKIQPNIFHKWQK